MNKFISILDKTLTSIFELFLALSVCLAAFMLIMMGLIELLELTCYLTGISEGLCLTF